MTGPDAAPLQTPLQPTPLAALHRELGARMVPFAGYEMPVQFAGGIIAEHNHTRAAASLFDVSHMGQVMVSGDDPAAALEALVPGDIRGLEIGRMRYTLLMAEDGGILDDLMVTRQPGGLALVVNAARKDTDLAHFNDRLGPGASAELHAGRALLALQGPAAAAVLARHAPDCADLVFMSAGEATVAGAGCWISRSGYTGEDGFEISMAAGQVEAVARALLAEPEVEPAGLGARDSLRLEAGLCLYGHDISEATTPVEAGLLWTIPRARRRPGAFPGAEVVLAQIEDGVARRRVGLRGHGRALAREGTEIVDVGDNTVGAVTSGGFGPTVGGPVAMGYVATGLAGNGTSLGLRVRGAVHPAAVTAMPFVPHRYAREVTLREGAE